MRPHLVLGAMIALVALAIGLVPVFTNCDAVVYNGMPSADLPEDLRLAGSVQGLEVDVAPPPPAAPMPCYWTSWSEMVLAVPLGVIGLVLVFAERNRTLRFLGVAGIAVGVLAVLFTTVFIGTCDSSFAVCNATMKPMLLLSGGLAVMFSATTLALT